MMAIALRGDSKLEYTPGDWAELWIPLAPESLCAWIPSTGHETRHKIDRSFLFLENFVHSSTPHVKNRNAFVLKYEPNEPT